MIGGRGLQRLQGQRSLRDGGQGNQLNIYDQNSDNFRTISPK